MKKSKCSISWSLSAHVERFPILVNFLCVIFGTDLNGLFGSMQGIKLFYSINYGKYALQLNLVFSYHIYLFNLTV